MARLYEGKLFEHDLPEVRDLLYGPGGQGHTSSAETHLIMGTPYELLPKLAAHARAAAEQKSISYRKFSVGAAVYVLDPVERRAAILYGANFTPFPGSPKRCAEMEVLEKAYRGGYARVDAIAVSGPLQTDEKSGLVSPTLHPCSSCRDLIRRHPLIYPDTMLLTADETGEAHEVYGMRDFFRLHGTNYFDDREDPYEDDQKLAEAIANGWGDEELRRKALFKRIAGLALERVKNLKSFGQR